MRTRCLKCGQHQHRTKDCEIKEKLEKPTCINCKEVGHLSSSFNCPKYPQIKKKTEKAQNPNGKKNTFQANKVAVKDFSYANALQGKNSTHNQTTSQSDTQTTTQNQNSPHPTDTENTNEKPFGIMDAVFEIKKTLR
ncbi:hypothetical protein TNCT_514591 [Trichonephila clavata]|uniref:CCHC-type domain-containing protein n=1 Tax=Trichonephila clavata TaxID=2740835 RepID=A0A8X6LHN0_TRICU|nr:hypothetical protein TNCT_514591 [Trichonephila clavata]